MDEFDKEQANNREYVLSMVKQDGKLYTNQYMQKV